MPDPVSTRLVPGLAEIIAGRVDRLDRAEVYVRRRWPNVRPSPGHPDVRAIIRWISDGGPQPWSDD